MLQWNKIAFLEQDIVYNIEVLNYHELRKTKPLTDIYISMHKRTQHTLHTLSIITHVQLLWLRRECIVHILLIHGCSSRIHHGIETKWNKLMEPLRVILL